MPSPPTFALLHGGGQGSWVWNEVVSLLEAKGAKTLALDVPGCGTKRHRSTIELGVDEVVNELIGDIRAAGLTNVFLVGHSQAGTLLPAMRRRDEILIRKLIYLSCSAPEPGMSIIDQMGRGIHGERPDEVGWPLDPDKFGRDVQYPLMFCNDMSDEQAAKFMHRPLNENWPLGVTYAAHWNYDDLVEVPSTYIFCGRDGILPVEWQARFAERLHCDRVSRLDAGHQAMMTQPGKLAELLFAETAGF